MMEERIRNPQLRGRCCTAEQAALLIKDGMTVAVSGFTPSGCPKAVPVALARQVRDGERWVRIRLWTGASTGREVDDALAEAGVIARRLPYQTSKVLREEINAVRQPSVAYTDLHLSQVASRARRGFMGELDVCIVEACAIREDGGLIPTTGVGNAPCFVEQAKQVIVELNMAQPAELEGMHDIFCADGALIPIESTSDRIGTEYIPCPPEKIAAIVITEKPDDLRSLAEPDVTTQAMAEHVVGLLQREVGAGRLPKRLILQSGVGNVANAVLSGLGQCDLEPMEFYSEVIQDSAITLLDQGKLRAVSGAALTLSPKMMEHFQSGLSEYRRNIVLRPQEISNNPAVIARLGLVAINTALEADIFGNINSTHVMGTNMMNGIGGSGDFARSAGLTIFLAKSVAKGGAISSIVPMVSHTDHTEHDVDILVTEQGVADLRNKCPKERAETIIEHCAHPSYRPLLWDYLRRAEERTHGAHTPHMLDECFSFHIRYQQTGSMLPEQKA